MQRIVDLSSSMPGLGIGGLRCMGCLSAGVMLHFRAQAAASLRMGRRSFTLRC